MEEGVRFAECLTPEEVQVDADNTARALVAEKQVFDAGTGQLTSSGEKVVLPARTVLSGGRYAAEHGTGSGRRTELRVGRALFPGSR